MASLDLINEMDSQQAWSKACRSIVVQKVLCAIQECSMDLIPFEEARQLLHLNQKICRGLQEIELDKIRGSVGRYHVSPRRSYRAVTTCVNAGSALGQPEPPKGCHLLSCTRWGRLTFSPMATTASQFPEWRVRRLSKHMCANTSALWN